MSQVIRFEKIVPEGKAMGHLKDGRAVFTIGPLPGEVARVGIRKQKRSYAEALLHEILEPSPQRSGAAEDHHMSCSPWQGVDYAYQLDLKQQMLREAFRQHHLETPFGAFVPAVQQFHYRNRLDFSLVPTRGRLQLAFHARGSWDSYVALPEGCCLGSQEMNAAALNLTDQLNATSFADTATITVRHARSTGQLLTILTTETQADWSGVRTDTLGNFLVTRPSPGSGVPGPIVFQAGESAITEHVAGIPLAYPYNAFFQANTPVFEKALEDITKEVSPEPSDEIVELYSGVGAIGLPLAIKGVHVHGIETVPEAITYAQRNAKVNGITTYSAEAIAAERMDAALLNRNCVILDPPRAGLHPRVIRWLLEAHPRQIIYLSCNPVTQARDIAALAPDYTCGLVRGYDFYPGTLHLEALAVLR